MKSANLKNEYFVVILTELILWPDMCSFFFFFFILIQVDLEGKKVVTGIATQGKLGLFVNAWTTFLELWYSLDQNTWYPAFKGQVNCQGENSQTKYILYFKSHVTRISAKPGPHWYVQV